MTAPVLTFFNNKGGVGKTTLVYHVAWMLAELGETVVVVDLDPQANLTGSFLDEDRLADLWEKDERPGASSTIYSCISPLLQTGDLRKPETIKIRERLHLVPGTMSLAGFEDELSTSWTASMGDSNLYRPFRVLTAFWQVAQMAAESVDANVIIVDVGPNLGAINRSALIASDFVAIPIGADLFSLQGLRNLGPALRAWRGLWQKRLENWSTPEFNLPAGQMQPLGYLVQQHSVRLKRPVKAYDRWLAKVPNTYRINVLNQAAGDPAVTTADDPYCLAMLKHYRSLIPMSQESQKPIFNLSSADGAIGAHQQSVELARKDFKSLTKLLLQKIRDEDNPQKRNPVAKRF